MPAMPAQGPVAKTPFLVALERVGNTSSKQELLQIRALLESGMSLIAIFQSLPQGHQHGVEEQEISHVAQDWFDSKTGWWTHSGPEHVMREGLIKSIDISIEYGESGEDGKPFPVDYWWVQDTGAFRFVSKISAQQQTVFLLTPTAPRPGAPATRRPARAKAKKAPKKAPTKTPRRPPRRLRRRPPRRRRRPSAAEARRNLPEVLAQERRSSGTTPSSRSARGTSSCRCRA